MYMLFNSQIWNTNKQTGIKYFIQFNGIIMKSTKMGQEPLDKFSPWSCALIYVSASLYVPVGIRTVCVCRMCMNPFTYL